MEVWPPTSLVELTAARALPAPICLPKPGQFLLRACQQGRGQMSPPKSKVEKSSSGSDIALRPQPQALPEKGLVAAETDVAPA